MRPVALLFPSILAAVACTTGGNLNSYPPARSPQGVQVEIGTSPRIVGELLSVDSTGLMVRTTGDQLVRIPLGLARYVQPEREFAVAVTSSGLRRLERVRLMSRFPQGISEELLEQLMRAYGQDSVVVVRR